MSTLPAAGLKCNPSDKVDHIPVDESMTITSRLEDMRAMLASNHPEMLRSAFEMASHIAQLPRSSADDGKLELECSLGISEAKGKRVARGWKPTMPPLEAQMVLTALERGEANWTSLDSEWRLFYDTYVQMPALPATGPKSRARLRSIDGTPEENITKTLLARTDFMCARSSPLRVRFQANLERCMHSGGRNRVLLLPTESVRVSLRRSFELDSESLVGIKYRFTVIKAWTGRTAKEAEMMMHSSGASPGENSVEVEIELDWPCRSPVRLLYACLGVLIKTQDLVELLSGVRDMRKSTFNKIDDAGKTVKIRSQCKRRSSPAARKGKVAKKSVRQK
jgi:hypothetical protein